jgi:hypothetical protein
MSLLFCRGYNVPTPFVEATMSLPLLYWLQCPYPFCSGYNVPTPFVVAAMSLPPFVWLQCPYSFVEATMSLPLL